MNTFIVIHIHVDANKVILSHTGTCGMSVVCTIKCFEKLIENLTKTISIFSNV